MWFVGDCGQAIIDGVAVPPHTKQLGSTALIRASQGGHTESVRLLVKSGADKNAKENVRILGFYFHSFVVSFQPFYILT